ncbi:MAG TPA: helix-turn-helix domain-containing protein [Fimbriimonas sp.]|nr:helix-turn-helix domain-containing protein [Fimbriimonas sp.]
MTSRELGQRIRERRKLLNINQSDVARLASCSKPSVVAAEAGKPTLRLDKLLAILQVLGLTIRLEDAGASKE